MEWLSSRRGKALLEQECRQARLALERVFGDQILQLGIWGPPGMLLESARTQEAFILGGPADANVHALTAFDRLAIASDSIDAVLLPHTLELSTSPHAVLREVYRVLRPDGTLIVLGFNPLSWVGIRHRFAYSGYPRGVMRHISRRRLCDWLNLLNMSVESVRPCYMAEPASGLLKWLQRSGLCAGAYQVVALKKTVPLTIIRPRIRPAPALVRGFVNTSTRNVA